MTVLRCEYDWITIVTVFLGWTVVGWMAALGWAIATKQAPTTVASVQQ